MLSTRGLSSRISASRLTPSRSGAATWTMLAPYPFFAALLLPVDESQVELADRVDHGSRAVQHVLRGRKGCVGDRYHAHAGGERGADAVLGVLHRRARSGRRTQ